jgi:prepilin-type N-terminal cleavage/methylation domain-containing protein
MKRSFICLRSTRLASFTLVELLVVVTIIAVLAAVTLDVGTTVFRAAKRASASNLASQIQTAATAYYTEYSVYPIPSTATAGQDFYAGASDVSDWENITYALCGNINPYTGAAVTTATVSNTRAIAFLTLKKSDVDANGVPLNPIYPTGAGPYEFCPADHAPEHEYDRRGCLG